MHAALQFQYSKLYAVDIVYAYTYDKARKLSVVAEETSNIDDSADESAAKRKRKAPATSDVEDGDGMFCCLL